MKKAIYIGGPLDGHEGPARSIYRNDDGTHMPASKGDREFIKSQWTGQRKYQGYSRQHRDGRVFYVHSSRFDGWSLHDA